MVSGSKFYVAAASTRKEMKTVECQTLLMWVFSEHPLRTVYLQYVLLAGPDRYWLALRLPLGG